MANVDVHSRQSVVIEFLTVEGSSLIVMHRLLRSVYGEDAVDVSSVRRWVRCFERRENTLVQLGAQCLNHCSKHVES